jgi:hypothetical protein
MNCIATFAIDAEEENEKFDLSVDQWIGNDYFRFTGMWAEFLEGSGDDFINIKMDHCIFGFDELVIREKKEDGDIYFPITIKQAKMLVSFLNSCISISETK